MNEVEPTIKFKRYYHYEEYYDMRFFLLHFLLIQYQVPTLGTASPNYCNHRFIQIIRTVEMVSIINPRNVHAYIA